jgi:hypothetical protein
MKCRMGRDCQNAASWIVEYPETDEVTAACADHAAACLVKEQVNLTSVRCVGPEMQSLKARIGKEPYPELVAKK